MSPVSLKKKELQLKRPEVCVDNIYSLAVDGYDSNDHDMMQCVLNEIARLCAEYFQLKEDGL